LKQKPVIRIVKKAKAALKAKDFRWQGIADQREKLQEVLEKVDVLNRVGINSQEALRYVVTQTLDTLQVYWADTNLI
jgi:hypothetical protein